MSFRLELDSSIKQEKITWDKFNLQSQLMLIGSYPEDEITIFGETKFIIKQR